MMDCGASFMQEKGPAARVPMPTNDVKLPVSSADNLVSPSLQNRQFCSLAMAGEGKKDKSFLGFQSVFSFL